MFDFGSGVWRPEGGILAEVADIPPGWGMRLVDPEVALILGPSGEPKSHLGNTQMSLVSYREGDRLFVATTSPFRLSLGPLPISDGRYFAASLQVGLVDLERLSAEALSTGLLTIDSLCTKISAVLRSNPPDEGGVNATLRSILNSQGCELVSLGSLSTYDKANVPPFEGLELEGGFVLESKLGEGAFGEVWLGRHREYGLLKAAKFVKDPDARPNLQREAKTVSALMQQVGSKHVAQLSGVSSEPFALVYDYVDGPDLNEYVRNKGGRLPTEEAIAITSQILETLELAHGVKRQGGTSLVHRDLHPGNVKLELRSGRPEVKLLDFGLAGSTRSHYEVSVARSGKDFIRPTHICADPESDSAVPDPRDDLFSVGVLLFWMLTGDYRRPVARDLVNLMPVDRPGWRAVLEAACVAPRASRVADAGQLQSWLNEKGGSRPELEIRLTPESGLNVPSADLVHADTVIVLGPGRYVGNLVFNEGRHVIRASSTVEATVLVGTSAAVLTVTGGELAISGVTLESGVPVDGETAVVGIHGGSLGLSGCTIVGANQAAVASLAAEGEITRVSAAESTIRNSGIGIRLTTGATVLGSALRIEGTLESGLVLESGGHLELRDSVISKCGGYGFESVNGDAELERVELSNCANSAAVLRGESNPSFRECVFRDGSENAVEGRDMSRGSFVGTTISRFAKPAVWLGEHANPVFRDCRLHDGASNGVWLTNEATGTFEGCELSGFASATVGYNERANPMFRSCTLHDGDMQGVWLTNEATGTFADCELWGFAGATVDLLERASPVFRVCEFYGGASNGVNASGDSTGTFDTCELREFANIDSATVALRERANPVFHNCKLHDGTANGVWLANDATGTFEGCELWGFAGAVVALLERANPVFRDCKLHDGTANGVWLANDATGTFQGCELWGFAGAVVALLERANPVFRDCRLHDGAANGVWLTNDARGTFEACDIWGFDNQDYATVSLGKRANPTFRDCKLRSGSGTGVLMDGYSRGSFESCTLSNFGASGIQVMENASPALTRVDSFENELYGLLVAGGSPFVTACRAWANKAGDTYGLNDEMATQVTVSPRTQQATDQTSVSSEVLDVAEVTQEVDANANAYDLNDEMAKQMTVAPRTQPTTDQTLVSSEGLDIAEGNRDIGLSPNVGISVIYDNASVPPHEGMVLEGGFVLVSMLGAGALGEVWLARHHQYGLLKVAKFVKDPDARSNLQREAKTLAGQMQKLETRHVARLSSISSDPFALIYDYVEGPNLTEYVTGKGGHLAMEEAIAIAAQILEPLAHAHAMSATEGHESYLVQRDLHPGNVKLELHSGQPDVKLLDFGLAGAQGQSNVSVARSGTDSIRPSHVFVDPESDSAAPDPLDDLYSVGVLLFWMLTGQARCPLAQDLLELVSADRPGLRAVLEASCVAPRNNRYADAVQLRAWLRDGGRTRPELEIQLNPGDNVRTIAADLVHADTVLVLAPGRYIGNLVYSGGKTVIRASGGVEETILVGESAAVLTVSGGEVFLTGVTLQSGLPVEDESAIVAARGGALELTGCSVLGTSMHGIASVLAEGETSRLTMLQSLVRNNGIGTRVTSGATVSLRSTRIEQTRGSGFVLESGARLEVRDGVLSACGGFGFESINGEAEFERVEFLNCANSAVILWGGSNPLFRNCTFRDGSSSAVEGMDDAQGIFIGCEFARFANWAIALGDRANPTFRDCRLHGGSSMGVVLAGDATGTFEQCALWGFAGAAVELMGRANPTFRDCKLHEGQSTGIVLAGDATGTFEQCALWGFAGAAVQLMGQANPTFRDCELHEGQSTGVVLAGDATGTFERCAVWGFASASVQLLDRANPIFRDCKLHDGQDIGFALAGDATGTFEGCELWGFSAVTVQLLERANPTFRDCKLHEGQSNGVVLAGGATGTFERCAVWGFARAAAQLLERANPTFRSCKFHEGQDIGVGLAGDATGTFEGCEIWGFAKVTVILLDHTSPTFVDCELHDGAGGGLHVTNDASGRLEGCDLWGFAGVTVHLQEQANPILRRCSLHHGPGTGIVIEGYSRGSFESCSVSRFGSSGIRVMENASPALIRVDSFENKLYGIRVEGGLPYLKDCRAWANQVANALGINSVMAKEVSFAPRVRS